jgi:hypothetical protein
MSRHARLLVVLTLAVGACAPVQKAPSPPSEAAPVPPMLAAPVTPGRYAVVPGQGRITIKVRRGGALAALGHNHVIVSDAISGVVDVAADPLASSARFALDVESFVVDDAAARAAAGPDFTSTTPSEADISGTRANMLGPKLLDAARFPAIEARFEVDGVQRDVTFGRLLLSLVGKEIGVPVEGYVTPSGDGIEIQARFAVTHADLGLTPLSVMGGALRVADELQIVVRLIARRV